MRRNSILQVHSQNHNLGDRSWIMGILNVTPDSFSDGGLHFETDKAVERGLEIIGEGADIIDVGGESTRPGSDQIPVEEELSRVIPVIASLRKQTKCLISVDTTKSEVARAALDAGADIINDISSFRFDPAMSQLAAQREVSVVLMHMKGTPKTMQVNPHYRDILGEIRTFLEDRMRAALDCGIKKERIILDPGIGFGKSYADNALLIKNLWFFESLGRPILVGVSRKSFIGKILDVPPRDRLEGTIAASLLSILHGAHILRVHDVAAVKRAVCVAESILNENSSSKTSAAKGNKEKHYVH